MVLWANNVKEGVKKGEGTHFEVGICAFGPCIVLSSSYKQILRDSCNSSIYPQNETILVDVVLGARAKIDGIFSVAP